METKPQRERVRPWRPILSVALGLVLLIGLLSSIKAMQIGAMIEQGENAVPPPETVTTVTVKAEAWEVALSAIGSLTAVYGVMVAAELPGKVVEITIGLAHLHHPLRAGNRIEVDICSSNFPRRARNTNSGHALLARDSDADIRIARNRVHHGAATPSFIELPVIRG